MGNARTALFNWLFARQKGGTYVLRIEDTDVERSEARYERQLLEDMKWLGIDWDEGPDAGGPYPPYRQSERLEIYHEHAEQLLREAKAYLCFCPADVLEQERDKAIAEQRPAPRSCPCAEINAAELEKRRAAGHAAAIRLRIPDEPIRFHDIVRGWVEFPYDAVSDPIVVRSTGMPVYNYVVVVDDALMKITHVIRGDDHLSNTPKQVVLYKAFGWQVPEFAHLSTILGADRQRLSKRHGAVSIANFRDSGVLPEALFNYLALLGWAPTGGDREIISKEELVKEFDLERVTPSAAVFDMDKLNWLNRHYIKASPPERIAQLARPYLESALCSAGSLTRQDGSETRPYTDGVLAWLDKLTALFAPYVDRLEQLPDRAAIVFDHNPQAAIASPDNAEVMNSPKIFAVLDAFTAKIMADPDAQARRLSPERFKAIVNEVKTETGVKGKELFHPIRIVLTGSHSGPDFDRLVPILEEGSRLELPKHVLSVYERVQAFAAARKE